ncbi:MAG: hypothetical protein ACRD1R_12400 [Acidobacteriota bacterium]
MDNLRHLAGAIILQAIDDAQLTSPAGDEARSWLLQDDDGFAFWCTVLGYDVETIRTALTAQIGTRRRIDRAAIVQFFWQHPGLSNREIGRRLRVGYERVRQTRLSL